MLRATRKSDGFEMVVKNIREASGKAETHGSLISERLEKLLSVWNELQESNDRDLIESSAKPLFKELIQLYQMSLLIEEMDAVNEAWMKPALDFLATEYENDLRVENVLTKEQVEDHIGWEY
jgi:hypothetical protein